MKIIIKKADLFTLKDGTEFKIIGDDNTCKLEIKDNKYQATIGCEVLEVTEEFNYNDIEILNNIGFYKNLSETFTHDSKTLKTKTRKLFLEMN